MYSVFSQSHLVLEVIQVRYRFCSKRVICKCEHVRVLECQQLWTPEFPPRPIEIGQQGRRGPRRVALSGDVGIEGVCEVDECVSAHPVCCAGKVIVLLQVTLVERTYSRNKLVPLPNVAPNVLRLGQQAQRISARGLEIKVALECRDTLVLWSEGVICAHTERGALGRVVGIQLADKVNLGVAKSDQEHSAHVFQKLVIRCDVETVEREQRPLVVDIAKDGRNLRKIGTVEEKGGILLTTCSRVFACSQGLSDGLLQKDAVDKWSPGRV